MSLALPTAAGHVPWWAYALGALAALLVTLVAVRVLMRYTRRGRHRAAEPMAASPRLAAVPPAPAVPQHARPAPWRTQWPQRTSSERLVGLLRPRYLRPAAPNAPSPVLPPRRVPEVAPTGERGQTVR